MIILLIVLLTALLVLLILDMIISKQRIKREQIEEIHQKIKVGLHDPNDVVSTSRSYDNSKDMD
jgi:hypothetical protein